jgi:enoyl-CoA hydratase
MPGLRCVVLGGAGESFCAGGDLRAVRAQTVAETMALNGELLDVADALDALGVPSVAALHGDVLGGGLELALACHIRVASDTVQLGLPEAGLGLIPGYGGTQRLANLAGKGKALEMILTGNRIDATEAYRAALVSRVTRPETLIATAKTIAEQILKQSSRAVAAAIRAVNAAGTSEGFETETREFSQCFGTPDFNEGVSAFLEKREPRFGDRPDDKQ